MSDFTKRFERQTRFAKLGDEGQAKLQDATVLLVGCGALGGSTVAKASHRCFGAVRARNVHDITCAKRCLKFGGPAARSSYPKTNR